jgi:hypothetical protein
MMKFAKQLVILATLAAAFSAQGESVLATGAGALNTTARLNFSVVVPKILYLQVGTGTLAAPSATIDTVTFNLTAAQVGSAAAVAGTSAPSATINARVLANNGTVTFTAAGSGAGLTGPGGSATIPWAQIVPTAVGALIHPPITGVAQSVAPTSGVVNQTAVYSFNYSNTNAQMAGTYTGQVTYTASIL